MMTYGWNYTIRADLEENKQMAEGIYAAESPNAALALALASLVKQGKEATNLRIVAREACILKES